SFMKEGAIIIGFMAPHKNAGMIVSMSSRKITAVSMELIPRITRAQSMDALSSQANIAGYKAVLIAAARLEKYFPQLMTAAGTVRPARVVVIGAGVAGLQAIATAKRLGAIVEVSDIRPEVKEQILSLGGKFIELPENEAVESEGGYAKEVTKDFLDKQQAILARHIAAADVVITTALVPGRPAPKLVTEEMIKGMAPGTVIVDLAVEEGGNCAFSEKNKEVNINGVSIIGNSNLAGTLSKDASSLYARNLKALLDLFIVKGELKVDLYEEIINGSLITHDGEILYPGKIIKQKGGATS
ncbi:MAG: NAD(P) transhydrogenase subunit alpha, partial [Cyclobacteriaceae bacterium]|nr:NAD(P) transhydrogenase subunit alpha [Cyclobacteriaceae bacterium]